MFCSKCGKELMDEAVICPGCGCPTINYYKNPPAVGSSTATTSVAAEILEDQKATHKEFIYTGYSEYYPQVRELADRAKTIHLLAIFGLASPLGFGLFSMLILKMGLTGFFLFSIIGTFLAVISGMMERKTNIPNPTLTYPSEISEFNAAKRKITNSIMLNRITIGIMAVLVLWVVIDLIK